jgi:hypothetical protein
VREPAGSLSLASVVAPPRRSSCHGPDPYNGRVREHLPRSGWPAWGLPPILVVYLLVTQSNGYFDLPYWFCLSAPATAVFGPWLIVAALRGADAGGPVAAKLAFAVVATVASVTALGFAVGLGFVHLGTVRAVVLAGMPAGAAVLAVAGGAAGWKYRVGPRPIQVLVVLALITMIDADLRTVAHNLLKDFGIYLRAGHNFLDGQPVYTIGLVSDYTRDPTLYPFVYPPVTLPLFAALASLPAVAAKGIWLAICAAAAAVALRVLGVRLRWLPVLLLWTPLVQGMYVGNAAIPAFALFAAAPIAGALLALPPVFKLQLGLPGLWLLRERRWRDLALAVALGLALIVGTLPLVGLNSWSLWLSQLSAFSSQVDQNRGMLGLSLAFWLGSLAAGAIGVAVTLAALTRRRGESLAGLGVAAIAVSPTVYPHGATMALPAMLRLRAPYLWFVLALTSTLSTLGGYWIGFAIAFVALWVPALSHQGGAESDHHPLGDATQPWPQLSA